MKAKQVLALLGAVLTLLTAATGVGDAAKDLFNGNKPV